MVISDVYYRARKMGLRAYHACLQAHKQPYLPVLDELVPEERRSRAFRWASCRFR